MDQHTGIEIEEIADGTAVDVPSNWEEEENFRHYKSSVGSRRHWRALVFRSASFIVLFIFFPLLVGCSDKQVTEDLNSIKRRLDKVEMRLALLEMKRQRIQRLESEIIKLRHSVEKLNKSVPSNAQKRKKTLNSAAKTDYHLVRPGDMLSNIARQYGISLNELCRLNQITPETIIHPRQALLVRPGGKQ